MGYVFKTLMTLVLFFGATKTLAFPDTVRHGYTSCMTCHNSPGGGGTLSNYGKFIAQELYSAFNTSENAIKWISQPDYDSTEPWQSGKQGSLNAVFGLLARGARTRVETSQVIIEDFKRMQFDLEAGLVKNQYLAFITTGFRGSSKKAGQNELDLKVRSFYVGARDLNYAIRAGRYYPDFGIRHPHHNISTRKGLYFDQGQEPYAIQGNIFLVPVDIALAYLEGARETQLDGKTGFSGQVIGKTAHSRTGISYLNMSQGGSKTSATSLHTQIGFTKDIYTYVEGAVRLDENSGVQSQDTLGYSELGWEVKRGIIPYLLYDVKSQVSQSSRQDSYGLGLRFYPYTHFELMLQYSEVHALTKASFDKGNFAFAMFNMYF